MEAWPRGLTRGFVGSEGTESPLLAFYAGCASAGSPRPGEHVALLVRSGRRPPSYAGSWHSFRITGTTVLHVNAYVAPA
jgi:hypothetical protein